MKERDPIQLNRNLDAINYEAQKAILSETMSGFRKDFIVEEALKEIKLITEERAQYLGKHGIGRKSRKPK